MIDFLKHEDIESLERLRPEEWPDIRPFFEYYLKTKFCTPIKISNGQQIIGLGSMICHKHSSWLAHIIVHRDYRNQGLGGKITQALIKLSIKKKLATQSLIATDLGYPVYLKKGFEIDTEYAVFTKGEKFTSPDISKNIVQFEPRFWKAILSLDYLVSGERREKVLEEKIKDASLYFYENRLQGLYLRGLGDGMIIAENPTAGLELMKLRLLEKDHAMLPVENEAGIRLLKTLGFIEKTKVKRLWLGKKLNWKPELLFNRIGGHLG